ncbi:MAG: hypothetical protein KatS3mg121_0520 [Gammaproteobacteria bacterium]|nr:MAG: hypothetical protein KatS3mg121_0520 [Gammaproteobacteria bacterium]
MTDAALSSLIRALARALQVCVDGGRLEFAHPDIELRPVPHIHGWDFIPRVPIPCDALLRGLPWTFSGPEPSWDLDPWNLFACDFPHCQVWFEIDLATRLVEVITYAGIPYHRPLDEVPELYEPPRVVLSEEEKARALEVLREFEAGSCAGPDGGRSGVVGRNRPPAAARSRRGRWHPGARRGTDGKSGR